MTFVDDCCGAKPPDTLTDEQGREWTPGDCWCTLPPGHDGKHHCQPCTDRFGTPGWADRQDTETEVTGA